MIEHHVQYLMENIFYLLTYNTVDGGIEGEAILMEERYYKFL